MYLCIRLLDLGKRERHKLIHLEEALVIMKTLASLRDLDKTLKIERSKALK